jgi:PRTRC genetic system protein B
LELHEALLIYRGNNQSFITHHPVIPNENAPPMLGPAQPLSMTFIDSLLRSLKRTTETEVLPDNVLAKGDQSLVWWTPRRRRQMFYRNAEKKGARLDGRVFPQPALVWRVNRGSLSIRALMADERPRGGTRLAFAPFWNLSSNGSVCLGSMRHPDGASVSSIEAWEQGFYESAFTHSNVARITLHSGGFEAMWSSLAGKRSPFPSEHLIALPETLGEFVRG